MATLALDRWPPSTRSAPVPDALRPPELAVIVPTFNERDNVDEVVARVALALVGIDWELILVDDDSPDGTAARVRAIGRRDARVRVIRRLGRRGLSSACIEGMLATTAPLLAIMDADLQHDPALLSEMYDRLRVGGVDLVVASRNVADGSYGGWSRSRAVISGLAARLGRSTACTKLSDPMSGFFMLRRRLFEDHVRDLTGIGFKILLDLVLSVRRPLSIAEVPLKFATRHRGESKLSPGVIWQYLLMLADKRFGRFVATRFIAFGAIGAAGLLVHFTALTTLLASHIVNFPAGQAIATGISIVVNYSVNNVLTYSDRTRRGWRWLSGLASFGLTCGFGGVANVGMADFLFRHSVAWPLAAVVGAMVGAVWNYGVSSRYTWREG